MWTVQSRSNFDNDGARPVPYLQLVSPVQTSMSQVLIKQASALDSKDMILTLEQPLFLCNHETVDTNQCPDKISLQPALPYL